MKKKSRVKRKSVDKKKRKPKSRQGRQNLSTIDKEAIKSLIRGRLKFRDTEDELLLHLEDHKYNIERATLYKLKKEIRDELGKRYEEIGTYELAEEHDLAIQMMKYLEKQLLNSAKNAEDVRDIVSISQEIRNVKRDLLDYYGSADIVENVFRHFKEKYGEQAEAEFQKAKNELQRKS